MTLYNYSNFDNKGLAYISVFVCFATICFSIAKIVSAKEDKENYYSVEKEIDRLENIDGIFQYKKDGFYINRKENAEFIKWSDILEVNAFTIPVLHRTKHNGLEIITEAKNYEFNSQQTEGFEKLGNQLFENLPDWKLDSPAIKINNFGLKKTNLKGIDLVFTLIFSEKPISPFHLQCR